MADSNFKQVVVNYVPSVYGGQEMSHDTVVVTKTATMENGSILKADGTEAAIADAATATHIINDTSFDVKEEGDVVAVAAVKALAQVKKANIKFSDGAYTSEALTALESKLVELV